MFADPTNMKKRTKSAFALASFLLFAMTGLWSQDNGSVRGTVLDKETGEPIIFGNVFLEGTSYGGTTDVDGFFTISNVPSGQYVLLATYIGFDTARITINIRSGGIVNQRLFLAPTGILLNAVDVSAQREQARSEVQVSTITLTPQQIKSLPSTGGQADLAQYLPVLPGIVTTGDQGGQLYIRGGSPIQNKMLLDGMTIYNPFHSIGFFSVFETETIRSVDVLTGGFNAEYGGRVSAIVDIQTREGNKKRLGGLVSLSPFQAKALVEGPIKPLKEEGGGSVSFLLTGKQSLLPETSKSLYGYATENDTLGLPYGFRDLYGKVSFLTGNGSKLNLFGFNFQDDVDFAGITKLNWQANGGGANFTVIPPNSNSIIDGVISYSKYDINLGEADEEPRNSSISNYSAGLNFINFGRNREVRYGFEFTGFQTDFRFTNFLGLKFQQQDFTTELSGYLKYRQVLGPLVIEPGFRVQYYASQATLSPEPRLGLKYNATDFLRIKLAGGLYSQNLLSTVNERDVVNLFVGFLAGPEETIFKPGTREAADHRLQKSIHAIFGVEVDLAKNIQVNVEPYLKRFTQLINVNRNKLSEQDPNFSVETGDAYGIDFSLNYKGAKTTFWGTYSYAFVNRDDGEQVYPTLFDRRHNVNMLGTYTFGATKSWEASVRWNFGSGFPFTLTQGFYTQFNFEDGLDTDVLSGNPNLGILFDTKRNGGRLPSYHRLDASVKKTISFGKTAKAEIVASVTNLYDRRNIFYFDRVRNRRVDQLPILPSLALTVQF